MKRRRFLRTSAAAASMTVVGTAGCTSVLSPDFDDPPRTITTQQPLGNVSDREREIARSARSNVVAIDVAMSTAEHGPGGFGTGWFISPNHVVTNSHVVEGGVEYTGWTFEGDSFGLELVDRVDDYHETGYDVALLRTDFSGEPLPTEPDAVPAKGDRLVQVGHPGGMGFWVLSVGEYVRETEYLDNFLTTIPGDKGSSGSPVLNLDGAVVGLTSGSSLVNPEVETTEEGRPVPADPVVYEEFPTYKLSRHVYMRDVRAKLDEWA